MCNRFNLLTFICFFCFTLSANSNIAKNILADADKKLYHPKMSGLKDLYFEVRFPYLKTRLNQQKIYGELKDIYFKVFWLSPGRLEVDIEGFPNGFKETRKSLKKMVKDQIGFIFPEKILSQLRSFKLSVEKNTSSGIKIKAVDEKYTSPINEVLLQLSGNRTIERMVSKSPSGTEIVDFGYSTEKWSSGKLLLTTVSVKNYQGKFAVTTSKTVDYTGQGQMGFPKSIEIISEQKLNIEDNGTSSQSKKFEDKILLSAYKVNLGVAGKRFGVSK